MTHINISYTGFSSPVFTEALRRMFFFVLQPLGCPLDGYI